MGTRIKNLIILLSVIQAFAACTFENGVAGGSASDNMRTLSVFLSNGADGGTKSLSNGIADDLAIHDACVFVFDGEGEHIISRYAGTEDAGALQNLCKVEGGKSYSVYVIANIGDITSSISEGCSTFDKSSMESWRYTLSNYEDLAIDGYLPMSGKSECYIADEEYQCVVSLSNLAGKVRLTLSKNLEEGYTATINSVKLKNAARYVYPFRDQSCVQSESDVFDESDYADITEVAAINIGNAVSFYALENRQGQSGSGNVGNGMSSYLELQATITNGEKSATPTYRWWVGDISDGVRTFDLIRGTEYILEIALNGEGFEEGDERVEDKDWQYSVVDIIVTPSYSRLYLGSTATFTAEVLPSELEPWQKEVTWSVSNPSIISIISQDGNSCTIRAKSIGTAYLIATSTIDATINASAEIEVFEDVITWGPLEYTAEADDIPASGGSSSATFHVTQKKYVNGIATDTIEVGTYYGSEVTADNLGTTETNWRIVGSSEYDEPIYFNGVWLETLSCDIWQKPNKKTHHENSINSYEIELEGNPTDYPAEGATGDISASGVKYSQTESWDTFTATGDELHNHTIGSPENDGTFEPIVSCNVSWAEIAGDRIIVSATSSSSSRFGIVTASAPASISGSYSGESVYEVITQEGMSLPEYSEVRLVSADASDIPASGGNESATFYLAQDILINGAVVETISWSESGNAVRGSDLGTPLTPRTKMGESSISGSKNGKSYSFSKDIFQEENKIESTTTAQINKNYQIQVIIGRTNFPAEGGSTSITRVSGNLYGTPVTTTSYSSGSSQTTTGAEQMVGTFSPDISIEGAGFSLFGTTVTAARNSSTNPGYATLYADPSPETAGYSGSPVEITLMQEGAEPEPQVLEITRFGTWHITSSQPAFGTGYWNVTVDYDWDTGYPELDTYLSRTYGAGSQLQQSWDEHNPYDTYIIYAEILGVERAIGALNN